MANELSTTSVKEGLIQVISAERFKAKPQAGENVTVIVMKKSGNVLNYYETLNSRQDQLSVGEQIWGNFVCYIVDMSIRKISIEGDFATNDRITNVHCKSIITYQVSDAKLAAIGVDDALLSLRDELTSVIKREISRLSIEQVFEQRLEEIIMRQDSQMRSICGIQLIKVSANLEWAKQALDELREQRNRGNKQKLEDEEIRRKRDLENKDIDHVDQLLVKLGLNTLPVDIRLKLLSMPREKAYEAIGGYIQQQRSLMQQNFSERAKQEYELLHKMIDRGILEDFDLQDLGKSLLDRYSHMITMEEMFGVSPSLMLGNTPKQALDSGDKKGGSKKKETPKDKEEDEEK